MKMEKVYIFQRYLKYDYRYDYRRTLYIISSTLAFFLKTYYCKESTFVLTIQNFNICITEETVNKCHPKRIHLLSHFVGSLFRQQN